MELWGILVPSALLMASWVSVRGWLDRGADRSLPVLAALLWVGHWYWETEVVQPEDNIRIDLVLFFPIQVGITVAACTSLWRTLQRRRIPPPRPQQSD